MPYLPPASVPPAAPRAELPRLAADGCAGSRTAPPGARVSLPSNHLGGNGGANLMGPTHCCGRSHLGVRGSWRGQCNMQATNFSGKLASSRRASFHAPTLLMSSGSTAACQISFPTRRELGGQVTSHIEIAGLSSTAIEKQIPLIIPEAPLRADTPTAALPPASKSTSRTTGWLPPGTSRVS
jgi:hypothetical protein